MKISTFIIAKNEEAKLAMALNSLYDVCDEIVVVDTGSTDKTKEIVRQYTGKVFDFEWINDFSAARNFALSKCSGDWIFYLDADDELVFPHAKYLRELVEQTNKNVVGYFVNYLYAVDKVQLVPRLFRNSLGLKFAMPVHEYLDIPEDLKKSFLVDAQIRIVHHKETAENPATLERNVAILEAVLAQDPDNFHLRFFLGREHFYLKKFENAVAILDQLLDEEILQDFSFLFQIYLYLGRCFEQLQRFRDAIVCFERAHQLDQRFAEPLIYTADILLYRAGKAEEAKKYYEQALVIPKPETTFSINPNFYHNYSRLQLLKIQQLGKPMALICGYYGKLNVGDELMLRSIIQNLQNRYRIVVASYDPRMTQKIHKVESVLHQDRLFDLALEQAAIVVIGGGTLFHDQGLGKNKNVEYYCGLIDKAAALKKEVILLGVGVDTLELQRNQQLLRKSFDRVKNILVRDEDSWKRLVSYGIHQERIEVIPDLIFGLDIGHKKVLNKKSKPRIGINLCPPLENDTHDFLVQIEKYLVPFLKSSADDFDFLFIPGQKNDLQYIEYLKQKFQLQLNFFEPDGAHYFESYFQILETCDALIATRYHLLLLGMIMQKSVYAFSYAEKTDRLLKDFPVELKRFEGEIHLKRRVKRDPGIESSNSPSLQKKRLASIIGKHF